MLMWGFLSWQVCGEGHVGHLECDGTENGCSAQEMPQKLRYSDEKKLTSGEEPMIR